MLNLLNIRSWTRCILFHCINLFWLHLNQPVIICLKCIIKTEAFIWNNVLSFIAPRILIQIFSVFTDCIKLFVSLLHSISSFDHSCTSKDIYQSSLIGHIAVMPKHIGFCNYGYRYRYRHIILLVEGVSPKTSLPWQPDVAQRANTPHSGQGNHLRSWWYGSLNSIQKIAFFRLAAPTKMSTRRSTDITCWKPFVWKIRRVSKWNGIRHYTIEG